MLLWRSAQWVRLRRKELCGGLSAPLRSAAIFPLSRRVLHLSWEAHNSPKRRIADCSDLRFSAGPSCTARRALHYYRTCRQPSSTFFADVNGNSLLFTSSLRHSSGTALRNNASSYLAFTGRRHLGYQTPFRALGHLIRIPAAIATAGAGVITFAQYKLSEFHDKYIPKWLSKAVDNFRDSARESWEALKEKDFGVPVFEIPAFLANLFSRGEGSSGSAGGGDYRAASETDDLTADPGPPIIKAAVVAAASSTGEKETGGFDTHRDDQLMLLTKRLIEVRNVLKNVDSADVLLLPSIVVIGSQSSGKSSVLEAIVGHEFLPKGSNMVTRRPIELTLVHTPDSEEEYGEFPQFLNERFHDFKQVQSKLKELNLAVPVSECISPEPVELRIYSKNVPDLTMIDLPGYIQISNRNQPEMLKEKISDLCESYIQKPNVILAVCAADVDLANSEALRASRKVDPLGLRTIGVITKMDMVPPDQGVEILCNTDYPLQLGYIGVVCKPPSKTASAGGKELVLAKRGDDGNVTEALIRAEQQFFRVHPEYSRRGINVGVGTLRRRLVQVLEDHMSRSLHSVVNSVQAELDEARYQFKVMYNDRRITAESYVAECMDTLKQRFKEFARQFGKPQVRQEVRWMLEQRVMDICAELYWTDPRVSELSGKAAAEDPYWQVKLDQASSRLTKSGVGRAATQFVVDALMQNMERLAAGEPFSYHPDTRRKILMFSSEILRNKFHTTVDQVENTIKPYKFEVECTEQEWQDGLRRAQTLLDRELAKCEEAAANIRTTVGRNKLKAAVKHCIEADRDATRRLVTAQAEGAVHGGVPSSTASNPTTPQTFSSPPPSPPERGMASRMYSWVKRTVMRAGNSEDSSLPPPHPGSSSSASSSAVSTVTPAVVDHELYEAVRPHYNPKLLDKAREALALRERSEVLKQRLSCLRSRQCRTSDCRASCPEVFLNIVAEKLAYTAVMFIQVELLNEFFFMFPREVDNRLYYDLEKSQIVRFARENPNIARQLALLERKMQLEDAMDKLMFLVRREGEAALQPISRRPGRGGLY